MSGARTVSCPDVLLADARAPPLAEWFSMKRFRAVLQLCSSSVGKGDSGMLALIEGVFTTPSILVAVFSAVSLLTLEDADCGALDIDSSLDEVSYSIS